MALKDTYSVKIAMRCMTCGATYAFETDDKTGFVTCLKCNRVYRGGEEELVRLNEALIEHEKQQLIEELNKDVAKELKDIFNI